VHRFPPSFGKESLRLGENTCNLQLKASPGPAGDLCFRGEQIVN
jgi:hypothetical protein